MIIPWGWKLEERQDDVKLFLGKFDPCCSIPRKKRQWIVRWSPVVLVDFVQLWTEKEGKQ